MEFQSEYIDHAVAFSTTEESIKHDAEGKKGRDKIRDAVQNSEKRHYKILPLHGVQMYCICLSL